MLDGMIVQKNKAHHSSQSIVILVHYTRHCHIPKHFQLPNIGNQMHV